jgi:hypothetical protein
MLPCFGTNKPVVECAHLHVHAGKVPVVAVCDFTVSLYHANSASNSGRSKCVLGYLITGGYSVGSLRQLHIFHG